MMLFNNYNNNMEDTSTKLLTSMTFNISIRQLPELIGSLSEFMEPAKIYTDTIVQK